MLDSRHLTPVYIKAISPPLNIIKLIKAPDVLAWFVLLQSQSLNLENEAKINGNGSTFSMK